MPESQATSDEQPDNASLILDHIRAHPGVHLRAIAVQTGVDLSVVRYHLKQLRKQGRIVVERFQNLAVHFAWEVGDEQALRHLPVLRQPRFRAIVAALLLDETADAAAVRHLLGLKTTTFSKYLGILERHGIVDVDRTSTPSGVVLVDPEACKAALLRLDASWFGRLVDGALDLADDLAQAGR